MYGDLAAIYDFTMVSLPTQCVHRRGSPAPVAQPSRLEAESLESIYTSFPKHFSPVSRGYWTGCMDRDTRYSVNNPGLAGITCCNRPRDVGSSCQAMFDFSQDLDTARVPVSYYVLLDSIRTRKVNTVFVTIALGSQDLYLRLNHVWSCSVLNPWFYCTAAPH